MAVLPGERFMIQQIGGTVMLFDTYGDRTLVTFDPADANAVAQAQKHIHDLEELDAEQKCFAHLWSGYFYAHANQYSVPHQPHRGDVVEALIKERRDSHDKDSLPWQIMDDFLDDYRLMADTGRELDAIPTNLPRLIDVDLDEPFDPDTEKAVAQAMGLVSAQVEKPRSNQGSSGPPGRVD